MRLLLLSIVVCCIFAHGLEAQTVIQNSNLSFGPASGFGYNYEFTVYQNAAATNPTSIWVAYSNPTIQVVQYNLDEGSDWYVVKPGDVFSPVNIQAGAFTKLIEVTSVPPYDPLYPAANVGFGDFWLGAATANTLFGPRTIFGWVHMHPGFNSLTMVENVMSYNSPGIIVGTTTLVPESATLTMSLCGIVAFFAISRHRN